MLSLMMALPLHLQALENVNGELATLEGRIREVTAQIEPVKEAKMAAHASHQARFILFYFVFCLI